MLTWTIIAVIALVLLGGWWISNTIRWTRRNGNLHRTSPKMFRRDRVDKDNHSTRPPAGDQN